MSNVCPVFHHYMKKCFKMSNFLFLSYRSIEDISMWIELSQSIGILFSRPVFSGVPLGITFTGWLLVPCYLLFWEFLSSCLTSQQQTQRQKTLRTQGNLLWERNEAGLGTHFMCLKNQTSLIIALARYCFSEQLSKMMCLCKGRCWESAIWWIPCFCISLFSSGNFTLFQTQV